MKYIPIAQRYTLTEHYKEGLLFVASRRMH